jgi:(S)-3,5-dihydroxyphenylglycine transaminase
MSYFYPHGGGTHRLRLSTSYLSATDIVDGIDRLAGFIESEAATSRVDHRHAPGRSARNRQEAPGR